MSDRDRFGDMIKRYAGALEPEEALLERARRFIDEVNSPARRLVTTRPDSAVNPKCAVTPRRGKAGAGEAWLKLFRDYDGDQCLRFPFATAARPYGAVTYGVRTMTAHRVMCLLAHKLPKDPTKTMALHSCGNGHLGCVNPNHLYWGDQSDNNRDAHRHKRDGKQPARPHPSARAREATA